jgi:heptaprenyl diphosphate synthase
MDGWTVSINKYTEYDLISAHAKLPDFPELRMNVLHAFLRYTTPVASQPKLQEAIALAVSLMQHGLDTHELVNGKEGTRERQMTVLAGDYFSSRFYQLLSQAESIHAIALVSQAVCDVNRLKMNVYLKTKRLLLTAEEYLRSAVEINTHLYVAFTSWMDEVYRKTCPPIMRTIAECECIAREITRVQPERIKNGWAYWYVLQNGTPDEMEWLVQGKLDETKLQTILLKYNIAGKLTDMWETKISELRNLLRSVQSDKLADELLQLTEPLFAARKQSRVQ